MKSRLARWMWTMGATTMLFASTKVARAASDPATCVNDIDCVSTPECGGTVCDYDQGQTCQPANEAASKKKRDGWCTVDTDCKCYALGAKCPNHIYCTFTVPSQAPQTTGAGGSSATTGGSGGSSSTGAGGAGGASTTGSGGSSATTGGFPPKGTGGGTTAAGTGGTDAPPAPTGERLSHCNVSAVPARGLASVGACVGLAAIALGARRRRRAA